MDRDHQCIHTMFTDKAITAGSNHFKVSSKLGFDVMPWYLVLANWSSLTKISREKVTMLLLQGEVCPVVVEHFG